MQQRCQDKLFGFFLSEAVTFEVDVCGRDPMV